MQQVCLPVFSHSCWSCYCFAADCDTDSHLAHAPGCLREKQTHDFFIVTLLGHPTSCLCQQQPQLAMFSMAAALQAGVAGDLTDLMQLHPWTTPAFFHRTELIPIWLGFSVFKTEGVYELNKTHLLYLDNTLSSFQEAVYN